MLSVTPYSVTHAWVEKYARSALRYKDKADRYINRANDEVLQSNALTSVSLSENHQKLSALCQGTEGTEYSVQVLFTPQGIKTSCSCPSLERDGCCKHLLAILLWLVEHKPAPPAPEHNQLGYEGSTGQVTQNKHSSDSQAQAAEQSEHNASSPTTATQNTAQSQGPQQSQLQQAEEVGAAQPRKLPAFLRAAMNAPNQNQQPTQQQKKTKAKRADKTAAHGKPMKQSKLPLLAQAAADNGVWLKAVTADKRRTVGDTTQAEDGGTHRYFVPGQSQEHTAPETAAPIPKRSSRKIGAPLADAMVLLTAQEMATVTDEQLLQECQSVLQHAPQTQAMLVPHNDKLGYREQSISEQPSISRIAGQCHRVDDNSMRNKSGAEPQLEQGSLHAGLQTQVDIPGVQTVTIGVDAWGQGARHQSQPQTVHFDSQQVVQLNASQGMSAAELTEKPSSPKTGPHVEQKSEVHGKIGQPDPAANLEAAKPSKRRGLMSRMLDEIFES
eukprot:jgi/Chrzof1/197/Cz01g06210.t1